MFDETIKFKYTFRPYQERTLNQMSQYLTDKKVHVVASPGSGKTILGLEIARILKEPVLILSPTITIKYQWIDRFISSFTDLKTMPEWISTDIYQLKFFNVATYQALHYAYKKTKFKNVVDDTDDVLLDKEEGDNSLEIIKAYNIIDEIKKHNIQTIILDEAHHLKSEWWNSLNKVIKSLDEVNVISLTATPPYDSDFPTWKKYTDLCGQIDAEITVPELVKAHNLCPHQDYIYFNEPTEDEKKIIAEYNKTVKNTLLMIQNNEAFTAALLNHKYIREPFLYEEELLDNVEYYSSILIYLKSQNIEISSDNLKILGNVSNIPSLDIDWFQVLLKHVILLDRKSYLEYEETIASIEAELHKIGIIEQGTLSFTNNPTLERNFLNSLGKLNSICNILKIEKASLKEDLRMVVLTDYIRKEYLDINTQITKLGVIPIFRELTEQNPDVKMAILTGSIFVIPTSLKEELCNLCIINKIDASLLKFDTLDFDSNYIKVSMPTRIRNAVMSLISKLFADGLIKVIVGTKSLLGEGWDEPSINSLVLASFVGSFMLSNQMRGRAIRVNSNPNKTANIWHLVCVTNNEETTFINNLDYQMLQRRFRAFVGLDYDKDIIESGIDRLSIVKEPFTKEQIELINTKMEERASNRLSLIAAWDKALDKIDSFKMMNVLKVEKLSGMKKIWFIDKQLILVFAFFVFILFMGLFDMAGLPWGIKVTFVVLAIYITIKFYKIYTMSKSESFIKAVGLITLNSLVAAHMFKTPKKNIKLNVTKNESGCISCYLKGALESEANLFTASMEEVFSKTMNQRYIITPYTHTLKPFTMYYNVPTVLSNNKENALIFSSYWKRKIGKHNLIYTRTEQGRKLLLRARMKDLSVKDKIMHKQEFY